MQHQCHLAVAFIGTLPSLKDRSAASLLPIPYSLSPSPYLAEFDTSRIIENCLATKRRGCSPPTPVRSDRTLSGSRADRTRQNGAP